MTGSLPSKTPGALAMRAIRALRTAMYWCLDSTVLLGPRAPSNTAIVVRLDNIGDFVVWLQSGAADIVAELRRDHQRIVVVGNSSWTPLARDLHLFDDTLGISPNAFMRRPFYRWRVLRAVRSLGASTIVNPRGGRVYLMEDEIVRISGARKRIAVRGLLLNISFGLRARSDRYYTRLIDVGESIREHEALRNERFADAFCEKRGAPVDPAPLLARPCSDLPSRFFAVAPGAGTAGRCWPIENFVPVIDELHRRTGLPCVVIGAASDHDAAQFLQRSCVGKVADHTGRHPLSETVAVLAAADLLVTNDSGPLHIAIWVGTRVVALMGGGQFGWFAPYPPGMRHADRLTTINHLMPCYFCDWHCRFDVSPSQPYPCVSRISVADVQAASEAALTAP